MLFHDCWRFGCCDCQSANHVGKHNVLQGLIMDSSSISEDIRRILSPFFDPAFYLARNEDVVGAGVDPLVHFHVTGWREGRNPSKEFDCTFYLQTYADVAAANMNPLLHFAWAGYSEGRIPKRPLDDERRILEGFEPLRDRLRHWEGAADHSDPRSVHELLAFLSQRKVAGRVVAISHDDYLVSVGGVQNVLRDELSAFERAGWDYIHVTPSAPLPMLADPADPHLLTIKVRAGRDYFGVVTTSALAAALAHLRGAGQQVHVIVHHLMGYSPEAVSLLMGDGEEPPYVWIHDFFAHCPSYALMRNDLKYCGGPPVNSAACNVCGYGRERVAHARRMHEFYARFRPIVVAPSRSALSNWKAIGSLAHSEAHIIPPARLAFERGSEGRARVSVGAPLRVAFLGGRVHLKGWKGFEEIATALRNDGRYRFYQFGSNEGQILSGAVRNVPVQVTELEPSAMIDALVAHEIDVAVVFPLCWETFSFTVHEALAAGAFVVAGAGTGNVWPAVAEHALERGACFDSIAAVREAFLSGRIVDMLGTSPRHRGVLSRGRGAADLVLAQSGRAEVLK
jgi:hypothetical protein